MGAAVLLALVAGALWGLNMVASRWGLDATGVGSDVGAFVSIAVAAVVCAACALAAGVDRSGLTADVIARYAVVGAIAPGAAQGMFLAAISSIGPSRTGVLVGTSPMFGVLLAIAFIGEPWQLAVIVGTVLTVVGGALVTWDPASVRAGSFIGAGSILATATALAFGVRDVAARELTGDLDLAVWWVATVILASGAVVIAVITVARQRELLAPARRALPEMAVSGGLVGFALPMLVWALSRGEVGVVAPLANGAQVLTVVTVSAVVFGARERSARLLGAVALVLIGGTLIGATA